MTGRPPKAPPCGIDFGTSNSALAYARGSAVALAALEDAQVTLPSAMFFPAQGAPQFGRAAQKLFFENEEGRFMRSLKRMLGTGLMGQGTVVNGRMMKFEDIIARFIAHIKARAEAQTGVALRQVVMGRPVHFVDGDAAADARAQDQLAAIARACGFDEVAFQFEPIAAAFAHEATMQGEALALVADVGGGTSDFTVIRLSRAHAQKADRSGDILGNAGIRTGGNDFDKALSLARFMPAFGMGSTYGGKNLQVPLAPFHEMSEWSKVNFLYTPRLKQEMRNIHAQSHAPQALGHFVTALEDELGHRVLAAVEDSKIGLTQGNAVTAPLDFVARGFGVTATRGDFDAAAAPHIDDIDASLRECLSRAQTEAAQIGMVVLTGGPTETPALRARITAHFPGAQVSEDNKLSSVALGLAHDALRRFV